MNCILYLTLSIAVMIAGSISDRFGRREVILFSLYVSALSTVICVLVANYATLVLSRALIGFSIGFNLALCCILIAEQVSSKQVSEDIILITSLVYTVGGVWSAILGYLVLDQLGWRIFILLTSLPLFIPPILLLHFYFGGNPTDQASEDGIGSVEVEVEAEQNKIVAPNFITRSIKISLYTLQL